MVHLKCDDSNQETGGNIYISLQLSCLEVAFACTCLCCVCSSSALEVELSAIQSVRMVDNPWPELRGMRVGTGMLSLSLSLSVCLSVCLCLSLSVSVCLSLSNTHIQSGLFI
jgi:hypothetical protein